MKSNLYKESVLRHLARYKTDTLGVLQNGVWVNNKQEYPHILPSELLKLNFLPGINIPEGIKLHEGAHHLNSSQVKCINFFEPLIHHKEGKALLLKMIAGEAKVPIEPETAIQTAYFEYVPNTAEGTNFDFYMQLSGGERFYFEIKYTEDGFGSIPAEKTNDGKYSRKWDNVYSKHLQQSLYLKDIPKDDFYRHYQIMRNISYIQTEKDYTVLLFPNENYNLVKQLTKAIGLEDRQRMKNVIILDWSRLISSALELSENTGLFEHYNLFKNKYGFFPISG